MNSTGTPDEANSLSRSDQWHAVTASFLGWTLDAFDFFVLVFLVDTLAAQFRVAPSKIILTMTATLAMRPVGALLFGLLADRYGRRRPLMANVVFFSLFELACGFAPNYTVFSCCVPFTALAWAESGVWERRWQWRVRPSGGEACFREWCRAGIRLDICWRRWLRGLCCRTGDGAPCSGWAAFRHCLRSIYASG